jgi:hypothetical protein
MVSSIAVRAIVLISAKQINGLPMEDSPFLLLKRTVMLQ